MNVEAYNSFCTVGSDHRVVCAQIKLSLRTAKNARKVRYDWKQFSNSHQIQEKYTVTVKNRFQELIEEEDGNGVRYEKFVEANRLAMEECVPLKPKKNTVRTSSDPRVIEARGKAGEAHNKWNKDIF